ncbi:MAG TPA: protein translocase subunit SecF [Thermoanaerobaculia bacterium]|jgi:preprotein translocase subunit SecF|nr:protein translocase subunit SecF [Thermoanaerobaculia bacterium]
MRFFQNANYDFLKYRKHWAVVSTLLSLLGLSVVVFHKGLNVGIDFAGGTQVVAQFLKPPTADQLRHSMAQAGLGDASIQGYGTENPDQFMIRTRLHGAGEEGQEKEIIGALDKIYNPGSHPAFDINKGGAEGLAALLFDADPLQLKAADITAARDAYTEVAQSILAVRRQGVVRDFQQLANVKGMTPEILQALKQRTYVGNFAVLSREVVGPTVGAELRQRGILAVVLSMLAMLVYIWIRFELRFGIGAVIALIHDVLVTLGLYALFGFEFNLTTIAAFLTLVGYSVNDSVVVFDRVREMLRKSRRMPFEKLLNDAVNMTLSRTILTASSVFLACLALLFLGGEVLRGFSFVMTVGVIVGTYSSVFVAASFALLWENWVQRRRDRQAPAPARAAEGKPRDTKAQRETRPSERKAAAGGRRR